MRLLSALLLLATPSFAAPKVVTDIIPVHALTAQVMQGVGTPELLLRPGASPHGYAMRPSEAAALETADVVFWIGADLTPWLEGAMVTLAGDAVSVELLELPVTTVLPFRKGATFAAHDHGDHEEHADHDGHGDHEDHAEHENHDDHDHDDHVAHSDHDDHAAHDDHDDHEGHRHGEHDPHAWLSPENAGVWLGVIADTLAEADPDNAEIYRANAAQGQADLTALQAELAVLLADHHDLRFVVLHDAFQYFETAFGLSAAGAISDGDASAPGAARLTELRNHFAEEAIACVFAEPQQSQRLISTVVEGTQARVSVLDPLGASLEPGPALYAQLLRTMARAIATCKDA